MRRIHTDTLKDAVKRLYLEMNCTIGRDVTETLRVGLKIEESPVGRMVLGQLLENNEIADRERIALCQDTGMAVLFVELGQEVWLEGGGFEDAVNQGVREAYDEGFFRKSVVSDPLFARVNTKDNTPAVIHLRLVPGDQIHITATAKGFGSENMSAVKMLVPADGEEGVLDCIVDTVRRAGPNPCPPVVVGVGVGGTLEIATLIAKRATTRPVGEHNPDPRYRALEEKALKAINDLGIGPGGLGGRVTALGVHIDWYPTHIAGMPVAVNMCCHAARHGECVIQAGEEIT